MPESVLQWWARRQRVSGTAVPYESGRFSEFWSGYRRVLAVYEPERNHGLLLSQVPLAADVYLVFNCFLGHEWVATPQEQRDRSGRDRRGRDTTCPECSRRTLMAGPSRYGAPADGAADAERADALQARDERAAARRRELAAAAEQTAAAAGAGVWRVEASGAGDPEQGAPAARASRGRESPVDPSRAAAPRASARLGDPLRPERSRTETPVAPPRARRQRPAPVPGGPPGEAFVDPKAMRLGTSAAEGELRRRLAEVLDQNLEFNAVRVAQPFHDRMHVWPDVILPDLRIALEWDTTGRIGDEHVGHRERSDRLKDRLLRRVGWEVVRLRGEGLRPIGPYDLDARGVSGALVDRILDRCSEIRGELFVAAYRR